MLRGAGVLSADDAMTAMSALPHLAEHATRWRCSEAGPKEQYSAQHTNMF
jgi:hypothetical protein